MSASLAGNATAPFVLLTWTRAKHQSLSKSLPAKQSFKCRFPKPSSSGHGALFRKEKLPQTFPVDGGRGKGSIHGGPPNPMLAPRQRRALWSAWCLRLRSHLRPTSTAVLLDTATRGWQCPRPPAARWKSPRSSFGNRLYRGSRQRQGSQKHRSHVTQV